MRERKEVKKLQQNLKYIEDQYAMKKMQEKTKAKSGTGMRPSMNAAMVDRVKRESLKQAGAGARKSMPSITEVSDNSK